MKVTKSLLVTAIEDVLPIVKDTFVRSMSVIAFDGDVVRANNGSIGITSKITTDVKCCVLGRKLYNVLQTLKAKDIELIHEGDTLFVRSDGFEASLLASGLDEYPIMISPIEKFKPIPKDLYEGMSLVRFSVSKDAMRPELCGISVKDNLIFSADGYRATKAQIETKLDREVLIHPAVVDLMLERNDITKYIITDNWIHLAIEDERVVISCSLLAYDYPDISSAFTGLDGLNEIPLPKEFNDVVSRACVATEGIFLLDRMVTLELSNDEIELTSEATRFGKIVEKVKLAKINESKNKPLSLKFKVNPVFLHESLKLGTKVYFDPGTICLKFKTDNFYHVVVVESESANGKS